MAYIVGYDPGGPVGQRLAPEIRAEIELLAPVNIPTGAVDNTKLGDGSVDNRTIDDKAVDNPKLDDAAVDARVVAAKSITAAKLADGSVNNTHVDIGVPVSLDVTGDPVALIFTPCTAAEYAALSTPNPNTIYFIH